MEESCIACLDSFSYSELCPLCTRRLNSEQIEFVKLREKLQKIQQSNKMKNSEIQTLFEKNKHCMDKTAKRNRLRRLITEQEELINTAISINSVEMKEKEVLEEDITKKQKEIANAKDEFKKNILQEKKAKEILYQSQDTLLEHKILLKNRKQDLVRELCSIFKFGWDGNNITILDDPIPLYHTLKSNVEVGHVLGNFCLFFRTLSIYLDTPIVHPIRVKGSQSSIQYTRQQEFPLFGTNSEDLKKGMALLIKNIESFCFLQGFVVKESGGALKSLLAIVNSPELGSDEPFDFDRNSKSTILHTQTDTLSDWVRV